MRVVLLMGGKIIYNDEDERGWQHAIEYNTPAVGECEDIVCK